MDWRVKAAIQAVFAAVPGGERLNFTAQRVIGSHSPAKLYANFLRHRDRFRAIKERMGCERPVVLEIGTGWDGAGIVAFALEGADKIYSFDTVRHLRLPLIRAMLKHIVEVDPTYHAQAATMLAAPDFDSFLRVANAEYRAPGDAANTGLPDGSVDLFFSRSVLEHIPSPILEKITRESARILRGRASHSIGLHDHLAETDPEISRIHFLSHGPLVWKLVNNRISYHNRWRAQDFVDLFGRHGGRIIYRQQRAFPRDIKAAQAMGLPEDAAITQFEVDVVFG